MEDRRTKGTENTVDPRALCKIQFRAFRHGKSRYSVSAIKLLNNPFAIN